MISRALKLLAWLQGFSSHAGLDHLYREEFEHSLKKQSGLVDISRLPGGEYIDPQIQASWLHWKSAEEQKDFSV